MILGVHISGVDKLADALTEVGRLGCNTMQVFARNPQRWRDDYLDSRDIKEFRERRDKSEISPVFIHISYLINLASPNKRLYHASIDAYVEDILEADLLGVDYIVTHMGSHKDTTEEAGIKRLTEALNAIIDKTKTLS